MLFTFLKSCKTIITTKKKNLQQKLCILCKAYNIYYLVLYWKRLPTSGDLFKKLTFRFVDFLILFLTSISLISALIFSFCILLILGLFFSFLLSSGVQSLAYWFYILLLSEHKHLSIKLEPIKLICCIFILLNLRSFLYLVTYSRPMDYWRLYYLVYKYWESRLRRLLSTDFVTFLSIVNFSFNFDLVGAQIHMITVFLSFLRHFCGLIHSLSYILCIWENYVLFFCLEYYIQVNWVYSVIKSSISWLIFLFNC